MKKYLSYIVALTIILIGLSSCHTSAPRLDYKALAQASVRLGVDIELQDNHKLYIHASEWIGTPYRAGGDSKRGTDCSGLVSQLYKKVYHTRLSRSTDGQLKESSKISRRNLREGDLVFFTSRASRKKVAHVGIYLKDGKFIHASTSQGVIVSTLREKYYTQHWLCGGRIDVYKRQHEDKLHLSIKNERVHFILHSVCTIFVVRLTRTYICQTMI